MAFTTQYVPVADGGVPRTITGYAMEALSGGQFVFCSGGTAAVNISGLTSFNTTDVIFAKASGLYFNGIATHNAASGALLTVATAGMFIVGAEGTVVGGGPVIANGADGVVPYTAELGSIGLHPIGRALTYAGSEGYCVIQVGQV